jgi:hypothetical protein
LHVIAPVSVINIWFGGTMANTGQVIYSSNSGSSWATANTPGNQLVHSIYFLNAQTGFCSGNHVLKSTDGGRMWAQQNYPGSGIFYSFSGIAGFLWYSSGNQIYYSSNQGETFALQYTAPSGGNYRQLSFTYEANDNMSTITGWGVSDNGGVSGYTDNTVGIEPAGNVIPNDFKLFQNYPNPFNPSTKIEFGIPKNSFIELAVYDMRGVLVKKIFKGSIKSGSYSAEFNGANLSSGVYFYRLTAGDPSAGSGQVFTETRKMILIK